MWYLVPTVFKVKAGMRIGIEMTPLTYTLTGVGYYVRHLLGELAALVEPGTIAGFIAGTRKLRADDHVVPCMRFPLPPRVLNAFWGRLGMPCVDTLLRGAEVYHAVNYVLPPLKNARGVLSIHDLGFLREPGWSSPKTRAPFERSIRRDALRADAVIACSRATKEDIVSLLGVDADRVEVIYDAADAAFAPVDRAVAARRVREALGVETPYLLFVSTVEARKNVTTLLSAFAHADIPHKLILAGGPGWRSEEAFGLVEQLRLSERVIITGYLRDRSLFPALYSAADAFVFPSWYEGFGLAMLEAMACGCPVIASNTSSLPEVGGDAPVYVDPGDAEGIARAMERVCGDASLRVAMASRGIVRARAFSWRKCAEETLACYGRLA